MIYDVLNPGFGLNPITANGSTDDTANLQLIINHANSQASSAIVFPGNRTVIISDQIRIYENMTLKSSDGRATLKCVALNLTSLFYCWSAANSITFQGLVFDGNNQQQRQAIGLQGGENIKFIDCVFSKVARIDPSGTTCISLSNINNSVIDGCTFIDSDGGVSYNGRNKNIRIKNNTFQDLTKHGIQIQGGNPIEANPVLNLIRFSDDVWITDNEIIIKPQLLGNKVHGIYFTCGDVEFKGNSPHHENVVVSGNFINGSGNLSTANGGSADLFSLKDIVRLKCYGNTARNSGDLGYAIERCHGGLVSNNTADQNNSCGISIFGSSNMSVTGNVCGNNEQDHDSSLNHPYGGIRVEFDSTHILVSGNHFYGEGLPNDPNQQQYGIVVRSATIDEITDPNLQTRSPYNIKIGVNHYTDHSEGDIYNEVTSTIIQDASASVAP